MEITIIKVLVPTATAFLMGILITPFLTHYLFKYKVWKKEGGKQALDGTPAVEFTRLKGEEETKTPRMGGIVIWGSVLLTASALGAVKFIFPQPIFDILDFWSRSQTWIPLSAMMIGASLGFLNDFYDISPGKQGIPLRVRLLLITILSGAIGWWFYSKLGVVNMGVPFGDTLYLGWLIIPLFIFLTLGLYASGVIDGIDGLSGGVFASIFGAYAGIALIQMQYDLAALAATFTGAILAFLWFNVPPARFWMTETGSMALTLALSVIVFMADDLGEGHGISLLLIVGLPLIVTVFSNVLQVTSKRFFGRRIFRIAPLHHHFEAIGWPSYKVTMRYWIISIICAIVGVAIATIA